MPTPRTYLYEHRRNIVSESTGTSLYKLLPGHICKFNYTGENVTTPTPLVLVLNNDWKKKLHGINLEYISEKTLAAVKDIVDTTIKKKAAELAKLRFRFFTPRIEDPYKFYHRSLKAALKASGVDPEITYRTYNHKGIKQIRIIDYKFRY